MKQKIGNCLKFIDKGTDFLQAPFLLFVRLYWGWQFAQTGWGKLHNLEKVTGFFTTLGIPLAGFAAPSIAGLELSGGLLLALGLVSRPMALLLAGNMLVAYLAADQEALLSIISDPDKFTGAAPFTFLMASLIVLVFGPGKASVDGWIASRGA